MRFEWDDAKAAANRRKHRVSFEEASSVFFDPFAITTPDEEHSTAEEREETIGLSSRLRVLVVIHTERVNDVVRIVSARRATRQEAFDYAEEVKARIEQGQG